jgi:LysM repeat protein
MKRTLNRVALLTLVMLCALAVGTGCTLMGAEAPPPVTIAASNTSVQPTRTPLAPIVTPTAVVTIDVFGTQTAIAMTGTPSTGGTPGAPTGVTPTPGIGVVTVTPGGITGTAGPTSTVSSASGGQQSCPSTYTVQAGDNLFRIALKFSLTYQELAAANGITDPTFITVGMILKIPKCGTQGSSGGTSPSGGTGTVQPQPGDTVAANGDILHTVKSGENLFRIALAYGLNWQDVAKYNGITSPDEIVVGQVIKIPTK